MKFLEDLFNGNVDNKLKGLKTYFTVTAITQITIGLTVIGIMLKLCFGKWKN